MIDFSGQVRETLVCQTNETEWSFPKGVLFLKQNIRKILQ